MRCIVSTCDRDSGASNGIGITFYTVPSEPSQRREWLRALGQEGWISMGVSVVCSEHFLAKDVYITKAGERRLRPNAIPVVQVCRICFATACKLYSMANNRKISQAYSSLAGLMTEREDDLPPYLCVTCVNQLMKCARFRTRCLRSHLLLLDLAQKQHPITLETIRSAHGKEINNTRLSVTRKIDHYDMDIVHVKGENDMTDISTLTSGDTNMIVLEIFNNQENFVDASMRQLHEETVIDDVKIEIDNCSGIINHNNIVEDRFANEERKSSLKSEKVDDDDGVRADDIADDEEDVNDTSLFERNDGGDADVASVTENNKLNGEQLKATDAKVDEDLPAQQSNPKAEEVVTQDSHWMGQIPQLKSVDLKNKLYCHLVPLNNVVPSHVCNICNKTFDNEFSLQKHTETHSSVKQYPCNICKKSFVVNSRLKRHLAIHAREDSYFCKLCGKYFKSQSNLSVHLRVHAGEKPYSCDSCKATFKDKRDLRKHIKIHTGVKPYSCDLCGKCFCIKSKLKRHVTTHFRKRKYVCELCNQTFRGYNNLSIHLKIHSGEKPYSCDVCKASFKDKRDLRKHLIIHSGIKPYSCDACKKSFGIKSKLRRHMMIHSGNKPYSCEVCLKTFSEKGNLQKHSRIHSGTKPYTCSICKKAFIENSVLKRHMRIHSRERRI